VEFVSSPSTESPPEEDDEPEPEHVSLEEASQCVEKLKTFVGKMENVSENIFRVTDDIAHCTLPLRRLIHILVL
jgi:hypothetical protein